MQPSKKRAALHWNGLSTHTLLPTCWAHMEVQARGGQVQQVPDEPWCNAAWGQHHRTGCLDHHRAHQAVGLQVHVWVWKTALRKRKTNVRTQETRPAYRPCHCSVPPPHPESQRHLPNHPMSQERPYPGYNPHSWTDTLDVDPLPAFWDSLELHSSLFSTKSWMTRGQLGLQG